MRPARGPGPGSGPVLVTCRADVPVGPAAGSGLGAHNDHNRDCHALNLPSRPPRRLSARPCQCRHGGPGRRDALCGVSGTAVADSAARLSHDSAAPGAHQWPRRGARPRSRLLPRHGFQVERFEVRSQPRTFDPLIRGHFVVRGCCGGERANAPKHSMMSELQ